MHLARQSVFSSPAPAHHALDVDADGNFFSIAKEDGFEVWRLWPLARIATRRLPGSLSHATLLHQTSLVFLLGGGGNPLYPPNKLIVWDDRKGKGVLELEFRERIIGLQARRGTLALAFRRRIVVFAIEGWTDSEPPSLDPKGKGRAGQQEGSLDYQISSSKPGTAGGTLRWVAEWETCDNPQGLMAISTAPGSTLLTIPGRQPGHVHVIHLTPCPSPATPSSSSMQFPPPLPSPAPALTPPKSTIIITHESALSSLTCPPSGTLFATSSERGTLVRVWDSRSGALVRELRRGADRAVIWGVGWRKDGRRLAVWSDKGTVHVFSLEARGSGGSGGGNAAEDADKNRGSSFSRLKPFLPVSLPKYFASEWSHAQYRLPSASGTGSGGGGVGGNGAFENEERCVIVWAEVPATVGTPSNSSTSTNTTPSHWRQQKPTATPVRDYSPSSVSPTSATKPPSTTTTSTSTDPPEHQLIALTYSGGWYRIALPGSTSSAATTPSSTSKRDRHRRSSVSSSTTQDDGNAEAGTSAATGKSFSNGPLCKLVEYRRFGEGAGFGSGGGVETSGD